MEHTERTKTIDRVIADANNLKRQYNVSLTDLKTGWNRVTKNGRRLASEIQPLVKRHPFATAGIALAAGAIAGAVVAALIARRSDPAVRLRDLWDSGEEKWRSFKNTVQRNVPT